MELYHYLPSYPDFYHNLSDVIESDDEEEDDMPYTSLLKKKEFFENKLARTEDKPEKAGKLMKHQTFIARFMSSHTPYNGILLMHQPGTGKTCASVAAIEKIRSENSDFKKALVIMKGQSLIDNYRNELVYKCTDGRYIPQEESDSDDMNLSKIEKRKRRKVRESVKSVYTFKTFETFSKEIEDIKNDEIIRNHYKNLIVVIDEVHNLRQNKSSKQYRNIHRFLHLIKNCKIILMTGTPMRDDPSEIADIMNLILPLGEQHQIKTKENFNHEYLDSNNVLSSLTKKNELKKLLRGRVSYLKGMKSDVTKVFVGNPLNTKHVLLYPVEMESVQAEIYNKIYTQEEKVDGSSEEDNENGDDDDDHEDDVTKVVKKKKGAFYLRSRMASLFVYPDKRTGRDGFEKNIKKIPPSLLNPSGGYGMRDDLYKAIMNGVNGVTDKKEKKLSNIRKYGCKYAECIKKILESPDESHFVYMEFVQNSGAILFTKLLELFNFSDSNDRIEEPRLRYALLTGEKSTEISSILETFNNPNNAKGQYINVIIGSSVLSEGFTLQNVQNVHILTPSWNFSETDQVIARAFRLFSHDSLKQIKQNITVKIYLYCAIFNHKLDRSIDWRMFQTSEDKDISIKSIERALKEISVDCELNKERNMERNSSNNTRECEYMECDYQCEEEPFNVNETDLDTSTYNLYYDSDAIDHYISIISTIFQTRYKITFLELRSMYNQKDIQTLMKAIHHMISNNHVIKDKLGFHCFLRQEHDYLYLTHTLKANHTFLDVYYVDHFPLQQNLYDEHFTILQKEKIMELCRTLTSDEDMKTTNIAKFPMDVQEIILKLAIQHTVVVGLDEKSIKNRDAILGYFKNKIFRMDDDTIIIDFQNQFQCFSISSQEWSICNDEQETFVKNIIDERSTILINPETHKGKGYLGKSLQKDGKSKFQIINLNVSLDAKNKVQASTGKKCQSYPKHELLDIIDKVKVEMDDITDDQFKKQVDLSLTETRQTLIDYVYDKLLVKKFNPIRDLYKTKEELLQKTKDDLIRILYWGSQGTLEMCDRLQTWFTKHDLMWRHGNPPIVRRID
jgi:hypothetical protein